MPTELMRFELTEAEILDASKALARATQDLERLEDARKQAAADLKAQAEARTAEQRRLGQLVANGYEYRPVPCTWCMHDPTDGQKALRRDYGGDLIRVEAMTAEERQEMLFPPRGRSAPENSGGR